MGFDISYHPIREQEIQEFFRKYYYTRGSAFSFLIEEKPNFKSYTKGWKDIVNIKINNPINDKIIDNYGSGVYIPAEKVIHLLSDYQNNGKIRQELDAFFSDQRIEVFLTALKCCKELKSGLLEATEVVEPNPFDIRESTSYSNLFNCDKEGVYLYIDAVEEQMKSIEKANDWDSGEVLSNTEYVKTNVNEIKPNEKKDFGKIFWENKTPPTLKASLCLYGMQ